MNKKGWMGATLIILLVLAIAVLFVYHKVKYNNAIRDVDTVEILSTTVEIISNKYVDSTSEFVYCLEGDIKGNVAIIERIYIPEQMEIHGNDIAFAGCSSEIFKINPLKFTLGTIHNHPHGICELGIQDAFTLGNSGDIIAGIICGENDFRFFSGTSLKESLEIQIREAIK